MNETEINALLNKLIPHQQGAQDQLVREMVTQSQREMYAGVGSEVDQKKMETNKQFRSTFNRLQIGQEKDATRGPRQPQQQAKSQKHQSTPSSVAQNAKPQRPTTKPSQKQALTSHLLEMRK